MARRGIAANQREWLVAELEDWRSRELVTPDQASRILALYDSPTDLAERRRAILLRTLMGIAAFLMGLAALLLIGYNWQRIPPGIKLLNAFALLIGLHAAAFYLRYRRNSKLLSDVTFGLACLVYGGAIFLIAQVFHFNAHSPGLVWWWAVGILPFALALDSVLLHALVAGLLAIWCGMEIFGFSTLGGWVFGLWRFLPSAAYSLPLLALPGLAWGYRRSSLATVWTYVVVLAWWAALQPLAWHQPELSPYFIGIVGAITMLAAACHRRESPFAAPYHELGTLLVTGPLLGLSFYEANRELLDRNKEDQPAEMVAAGVLIVVTLAAVAGALSFAARFRGAPSSRSDERLLETARRQWLPVALSALMAFFVVWHVARGGPLVPTILANVALIALGFWLISTGLRAQNGRTFASGVVYLLAWCIMRYIDLFGDFGGMLGAALLFFLCGIAMFGVAWFWRQRKEESHV